MDCSKCVSFNVCQYIGEARAQLDSIKTITKDSLPFSIKIECKYFNEDKRPKDYKQFTLQQTQSCFRQQY